MSLDDPHILTPDEAEEYGIERATDDLGPAEDEHVDSIHEESKNDRA